MLQLDWFTVILLIGIAQGVLLALALLNKRDGDHSANRFIALSLLIQSVILVDELLLNADVEGRYLHLEGVIWPTVFMLGPLFWWYTRSLLGERANFARGQLIHLLPAFLSAIFLLPFYMLNTDEKRTFLDTILYTDTIVGDWRETVFWIFFLSMVWHTGIYAVMVLRRIYQHRRSLPDNFSFEENISLRWLNGVVVTYLIIWILFFFSLTGTTDHILYLSDTLLYLSMVANIFVTGFFAVRQPAIFAKLPPSAAMPTEPEPSKYLSSSLSAGQSKYLLQQLLDLMESAKPYREGKLTLLQLAALLDISPNHLSQVINEQLARSFHNFVNAYRVKEAQQLLLDEPDRTVLDIALDAGFNSKSAFYKVFKQQCNMTPLQFQRENQP
ncbi:MAG: AraC family transcriptional regulator [Chloroflexi bacterium]|nr:AraC family transcriptional regulator [Chloroflexota bacterium]